MFKDKPIDILIIAGEASGDLHSSALMRELKKLNNNINFFGIGGSKMLSEGQNQLYGIDKLAFLGFIEVVEHLPFIKKVQREVLNLVDEKNIKNVILVDYPGFNLNLAKKLKKRRAKIFYYISPQLWAWGKNRIKKIKKYTDKMLVVFPFEKNFYQSFNVPSEFVGHPLIERMLNYNFLSKDDLYDALHLDKNKEILLLLPGSRQNEIKKLFPASVAAAKRLEKKFNLQTVILSPQNIDKNIYLNLIDDKNIKVVNNYGYDLMKHSKFGIIKSGTSTLEAGLLELPMVVIYKTSLLTYLIGKSIIKIPNIAIPNIVLGKSVVPELIQNRMSAENLERNISSILSDENKYNLIKENLKLLKKILGEKSASINAAEIVYKGLDGI